MTNLSIARSGVPSALVFFCALVAVQVESAAAQTARNLNCSGCVRSQTIKNNGIKSKDIRDGQVKNADLGANAVTGTKIADDAVTSSKIANGALQAVDMGSNAKPGAADFTADVGVSGLTTTDTVVQSVTTSLPGPGVVIVSASGYASFESSPASVRCVITKDTAIAGPTFRTQGNNIANARRAVLAGTRGFEEVSGGSHTYNLVCEANVGTASVHNVMMTAMFFPNRN